MSDGTRLIHRFWAGAEMPEDYEVFGQMWQELNPVWDVVLWNEQALAEFPDLKPIFDSLYERDGGRHGIELYVQMADVMGYALVEKYGGVYANCDMQPLRPLEGLPDRAWASLENNEDGRIVNAIIGAPEPEDRFWKGLLDGLSERYFSNPTAEMIDTTGPAYLTDYAHAHPEQLFVYPVETFNPIHWRDVPVGGDASEFLDSLSPATIAVHHWGHRKDGRSNRVETATT